MGYIGNDSVTQNFTPAVDYFNGNGSTTSFTLSRTVGSAFDVQAFIENVPQNPSSAFTVAGNVITFTSAPPSGTNNIYVRYTSPVTQLVKPAPGTVSPTEINSAYSLWNLSGSDINYTAGNVAIGTTTADGKLTIETTNSNTPRIRFQNASYDGDAAISTFVSSTGTDVILGSNLYINSAGNLARFDATQAGSYVYAGRTGVLYFGTNDTGGVATERMRILADGAIGFGTDSWGGAYGISMSNFSDSASYGKSMLFNSPYNGTRNAINFQYNSSQVGTIVTGTSSTSYNSGSDYRLKDNPQPLTGSGAFIDALQPKTWTWKVDGKKGVGFIAHEVQEVSPDSVSGEKDAVDENGKPIIQTMEYGSSEFIANIILELQELRKRVAELEAK